MCLTESMTPFPHTMEVPHKKLGIGGQAGME